MKYPDEKTWRQAFAETYHYPAQMAILTVLVGLVSYGAAWWWLPAIITPNLTKLAIIVVGAMATYIGLFGWFICAVELRAKETPMAAEARERATLKKLKDKYEQHP